MRGMIGIHLEAPRLYRAAIPPAPAFTVVAADIAFVAFAVFVVAFAVFVVVFAVFVV